MDINELKKVGAKALVVSLEICQNSLKDGSHYGAKLDFHSAIREFTTVIEFFPKLVELTTSLNLPPKTLQQGLMAIVDLTCKAYLGRAVAYMKIGEKEKGNADMIMAEKVKDTLTVPPQSKNHELGNSSQTPPAEATQFTNSSNRMAYRDFEYSRMGSGIEIKKYIGSATTVVIPSQIDNLPVTIIGEGAFGYCKSLTSIQIPNSVTTIGNYAFQRCISLTSVRLLNPNTSIAESAFADCNSSLRILREPTTGTVVEIPNQSNNKDTAIGCLGCSVILHGIYWVIKSIWNFIFG